MTNILDGLMKTEHQKKQEYLADYLEFLRSEAEERKQLLQALRDGSIEFKELHLSTQQAYSDMARLLKMLLDDFYKQRVFVENGYMISQNVFYEVNYQERRYLFAFSPVAVVIQTSLGGATINIAANTWTQLSFPKGTRITVPAAPDSAPVMVWIRATDSNIL